MHSNLKQVSIKIAAACGCDDSSDMAYVLGISLAISAFAMSLAWMIPTLAG